MRLIFSLLLRNGFSISKTVLEFYKLSRIKAKSPACKILFINPFLANSVITSTTIAKTCGDNTNSWWAPTWIQKYSHNSDSTLTFVFFCFDRSLSMLLQLLLVKLSISSPTPSPFSELYQMPSQYPQNIYTTAFLNPYAPDAYFSQQAMCLSFHCWA